MSDVKRLSLGRGTAALAALALLLVGAGVTYVLVRDGSEREHERMDMSGARAAGSATAPAQPAAPPAAAASDAPLPDIDITLTKEAVTRAGIEVAPVATVGAEEGVTLPGVVGADEYRRVAVTPLVSGRITRVNAELGGHVRRGATLALIYSPELADAQTKYLSARAQLEAATQELKRTERLVEIGAASQQELERIRASHTTTATAVQGARSQLVLLGMPSAAIARLTSASGISATTSVPAPISGVVTERQANLGLNVDPSMPLFTIVDLSSVWVLGDLYEKDFPRVRVGSRATITTTAYPGLTVAGRVAYIDPQLNEQTRTARVRVEVPNPRGELRLGMYAEMQIAGVSSTLVVTIPRAAIQTVGNRQVVYLARSGQPGQFVEREVRVGRTRGDAVEITAGLSPGDAVVTKGSFFVRAERERLGLRTPRNAATAPGGMPGMPMGQPEVKRPAAASASAGVVKIRVSEAGFEPARVEVQKGGKAVLEFIRVSEKTCATEVAVPSQQIRKALPLNTPVRVEVRAERSGQIEFLCGMAMLKGSVIVR